MRFILIIAVVVLVFGCGKDGLTTKPQLKYRSVNSSTIGGSQNLRVRLDISDKEADYTTLLGVKKIVIGGCAADTFTELGKFFIPVEFVDSKEKEGEVNVDLSAGDRGPNSCSLPGNHTMTDTVAYLFWTIDKAGNKSDTARTQNIIILGN